MRFRPYALRLVLFGGALAAAAAAAEAPVLELNAIYSCAPPMSFKVFSCTGADPGARCDLQNYTNGTPDRRGSVPRQQVLQVMGQCHLQTAAEARAHPPGAELAPGAAAAASAAGAFKVGDRVRINAGEAQVLQVRGNSYYLRTNQGVELWMSYPADVKRLGKLTAEDHALGQYDEGDYVQVLVDGRWRDGKIVGQPAPDSFAVKLASGEELQAPPRYLHPASAPPPPAQRAAGQPPKPGLAGCPAKYDGRWGPVNGMGGLSLVFRSGKVSMSVGLAGAMGGVEEFECWSAGSHFELYKAGAFSAEQFALDLNNDGTIATPFGDVTKKGN